MSELKTKKSWFEKNTLGSYLIILSVIPIAIVIYNINDNVNQRKKINEPIPQVKEVRIGEASVYAEIARTTDCQELQERFNIAEVNGDRNRSNGRLELATISTEYMSAINDRMEGMNCY